MAAKIKVDPGRLLDLLMVARHGSFSAAAEATNVSQPGLSRSIALLEREVGSSLLDRGRHGARANRAGEALIFYAEALEALLQRAEEEMRLRALGLSGSVRLGVTPITAAGIVPKALERLVSEAPDIHVAITEGLDSEIADMLRRGKLDLVVSRIGVGPEFPDIVEERLFFADWTLITRAGHPLGQRSLIKLADLKDAQWVLPAGGSAFRQQMERVFAMSDLGWPARSINTNSILAIKSIVMNTDCVSLMAPELVAVETAAGRLQAIPVKDIGQQRPIGLMWRRNEHLPPIASRLAVILRGLASDQKSSPRKKRNV